MTLSIRAKLLWIAAFFLAFGLLNAGVVYYMLGRMADDGRVVNFAGIVRGGSQRLVKKELSGLADDKLQAKVSQLITGLVQGDSALGLPPATDQSFIVCMERVQQSWVMLGTLIQSCRKDPAQRGQLLSASEAFFKVTDEAVSAAEKVAQGKVAGLKRLQLVLLSSNVVLCLVVAGLVVRGISRPLKQTEQSIALLAGRDLTVQVPVMAKDEIGMIGDSINHVVADLRTELKAISDEVQTLSAASEQLSAVGKQVMANSEETARQSNVVAAASEQVSRNVNSVATSSEEMQSSIQEIARNASQAAGIAGDAVGMAKGANDTMVKLDQSSQEIGSVMSVIAGIAAQTNLLALNATIEAARAGEAGKGFAVVAGEVKALSLQTSQATAEIGERIKAMQADTAGAVEAIRRIGEIIERINQFQSAIASAVEQQAATTREISKNVIEAAGGASEIARNISTVSQAANSTTDGASQTATAAAELARLSIQLKQVVDHYKIR